MQKLTKIQILKINKYITDEAKKQRIPGIAIGIYKHGKIVFSKGYGVGRLNSKFKINPRTIFCLGSIGKQFISAAIMILVEEHKISVEDRLFDYFPNSPKSWKLIKIKHMLSHTSGIGEYQNDYGDADSEFNGPKSLFYSQRNFSEDELAKRSQRLRLNFKPGEKWAYCNTNYMLLGIIIHKITGMFWLDYLKLRIFRPYGMKSVRLVYRKNIKSDIPLGYHIKNGKLKKVVWWSDTFNSVADGTFYCNVLDLAKWDNVLYCNKLLSKTSLKRIWTVFKLNDGKPNRDNYGFGWEINMLDGHKVIEHNGNWQGFNAHIARYIDDKITVVVLANLLEAKTTQMSHDIAKMLII